MRRFVSNAVLLLIAAGAYADDAALAHGAELLGPFKMSLKSALVAGMQQGPAAAISACREQAPEIAESLSVDGVTVGRSSHRLRNADNVAPEWAAPLLQAYLDNDDRAPRAVAISDGRWGYVEAIVLQPLCVTCHGESLAPEIRTRIEELYPEDRATGFAVGDFRGIFWAEFPVQE